jgi:hypothetical protein
MLTIIEVKPVGVVMCPAVLTPDELLRMLALPHITHVQVSGGGQRWIREIAKRSGVLYSTKNIAEKLILLRRVTSPRPTMSLEQIDQHIAFHADMVSTLVKERPLLLEHDKRTLDVMAKSKRKAVEHFQRGDDGRFMADEVSELPTGTPPKAPPNPLSHDRLGGGTYESEEDELEALRLALEETGTDLPDRQSALEEDE